ncbi:MAG TPA: hypothetical protein VH113_12015 [Gemmatimonadales bacterium]|jgi:hypothetical protein|nr:hypothetical protein [Gemmatimonadales bacterium]
MNRPTWLALLSLIAAPLTAQARDTSHARMQARGQMAMGVDQNASKHVFDDSADGGRIELQADSTDSTTIAVIRAHLSTVASAFQTGNFSTPEFVHGGSVPGTEVMAAKRSAITYTFAPLPRGGEVRISTHDAEALHAIHQFLAYQRQEHHAMGHAMH